VSSDI